MLYAVPNGAVQLYFDNNKKLETTSTGVSVTGQITATSHIDLPDAAELKLGDSDELSISHAANGHSYILENGSGNLNIHATHILLKDISGNSKFETTANGTNHTGTIHTITGDFYPSNDNNDRLGLSNRRWSQVNGYEFNVNEFAKFFDNIPAKFGNSDDLQIFHDGTNSVIQNNTGNFYLKTINGEFHLVGRPNGATELYYDHSKKLETSSAGVQVTGALNVTTTMHIPDGSIGLQIGSSNDLRLYHSGHSVVQNTNAAALLIASSETHIVNAALSENIAKFIQNGSVQLYYDNSEKLYTTADGIESKGELHFKSPSSFTGEQTGRIEWWNENDAGVMAKIGVDRTASLHAPADLVFSTSTNVDTSANGSDGDITERVRVSSNGLRLTNQPCFYAYSNVTRNNYGGGLVVAYTATHHNQGSHYSTSTYRFTAPVDGIYVFGGNPGYVESGQTYSLYLRINGAVRTEVGRVVQGNFPTHSQFGFSVSVKLSANDYVDLYQLGRMHHNASFSHWWGYFLG